MKRLISFCAMLLLCVVASAQIIDKNEINEHGVRIIRAAQSVVMEDDMYLGVCLEYHKSPQGIENYYVTLLIPKGIKNTIIKDGQEIKFKTINDEAVIGLAVKDCPCRFVNGNWSYITMYVISAETAEKLSQKVSKIRINYTTPGSTSFFDIDTSDGIMSRYFKRAYAAINKTIPQPADKDRSEF